MSTGISSMWIDRYSDPCSLVEIERRSVIFGQPYLVDKNETLGGGVDRLRRALQAIYIPTQKTSETILRELERAQEHARTVYANEETILANIYGRQDLCHDENKTPTLITGLSGSGKSSMRKTIKRILGDGRRLPIGDKHILQTYPYLDVTVGPRDTLAGLLTPLARPEIREGSLRVKQRDFPLDCSNWLRQSGVCLFGVDEMQFLTQSADASAQVSKALLAYHSLGVPWHVVMNFSLAWKLLRRPHEVKRRLLGRVVVIVPDAPGSAEWYRLLIEYSNVCQSICSFELQGQAEQLWNFTAGLKGELLELIALAYSCCLERGARLIKWDDIVAARGSASFFGSRETIDALICHGVTGRDLPDHLKCPFEDEAIMVNLRDYSRHLQQARQATVAIREIRSAMQIKELSAIDEVAQTLSFEQEHAAMDMQARPAEVVSIQAASKKRKRRPLTAENLLEGARSAEKLRTYSTVEKNLGTDRA